MADTSSYRPDLPDYGAYLQWPQAGISWIHPHDVAIAHRVFPSRRVWRRVRFDGTYYHLEYGRQRVRVRPTMWTRLPDCDVSVGDQVELSSDYGREEAGIARIANIFANRAADGFEFQLRRTKMLLPKLFTRQQFTPLHVRHHLGEGYYAHPKPNFEPPQEVELLDVGRLDE